MRYHYSTFKWSTGQAHHYLQQRRWGSQITCIPHPWSSQYCWLPPGNTLCYSLTTSFLPHCCAPRIWRKWKENSSAENRCFYGHWHRRQLWRKNPSTVNPINTDTGGAIESVSINRGVSIKWVEFRVNVRAYFVQRQSNC